MDFVIWGNGLRGKDFVDFIDKQNIVAIVDGDQSLQGSVYEGIDIISPEQYLIEYRNCPVIVTPKDAEEEMIRQLNKAGIYWVFAFTDEWTSIVGLFRQLSIDELISDYNQKEALCIWGYNALGLLLYDYLCSKGYSCEMIQNDSINEDIKLYLENTLNIKVESKENCRAKQSRILLTTHMSDNDKDFFGGNKIEKYYNLDREKERFYNPFIEKYKAIHPGKRCFIVATGPSLAITDLEKLYKNKEICISMNGIFAAFAETSWRPDYYIISDPLVTKKWKDQVINFEITAKFVADAACEQAEELGIKWHIINLFKDGEVMDFSDDFAYGAYCYGTVTHPALQLAVYMGFTEIYLLGVDCNYKKGSYSNHFYKEKVKDRSGANVDAMRSGYLSIKKYADSHGIKIYNATRGGMLEVFERVDFDSLF